MRRWRQTVGYRCVIRSAQRRKSWGLVRRLSLFTLGQGKTQKVLAVMPSDEYILEMMIGCR